jgi:hypothetical protein
MPLPVKNLLGQWRLKRCSKGTTPQAPLPAKKNPDGGDKDVVPKRKKKI